MHGRNHATAVCRNRRNSPGFRIRIRLAAVGRNRFAHAVPRSAAVGRRVPVTHRVRARERGHAQRRDRGHARFRLALLGLVAVSRVDVALFVRDHARSCHRYLRLSEGVVGA